MFSTKNNKFFLNFEQINNTAFHANIHLRKRQNERNTRRFVRTNQNGFKTGCLIMKCYIIQ